MIHILLIIAAILYVLIGAGVATYTFEHTTATDFTKRTIFAAGLGLLWLPFVLYTGGYALLHLLAG